MKIYPAIDLMDGKCVRLYKGDFKQKKEYSSDPVETALFFKNDSAKYLHIVDLDGAKHGSRKHTAIINKIIKQSELKVQIGGGIRTLDDVKGLIDAGADKIIIGSLAVKEPEKAFDIISKVDPDRITLGLDIIWQDETPLIAIDGWTKTGDIRFYDLLKKYSVLGVKHILCTDVSLDGTMEGPNFDLYKKLQHDFSELRFFASGGISNLEDIIKLKKMNMFAAITGKAVYENKFTVREALEC